MRFNDHLGTFPVEVGLCHDGRSTLDTGLFGKVYWGQTGAFGALFPVQAKDDVGLSGSEVGGLIILAGVIGLVVALAIAAAAIAAGIWLAKRKGGKR